MTVKELIKELQKIKDKNLQVFWSDHDHGDYELNAEVRRVSIVDRTKAKDEVYIKRQLKETEYAPVKYVNIR